MNKTNIEHSTSNAEHRRGAGYPHRLAEADVPPLLPTGGEGWGEEATFIEFPLPVPLPTHASRGEGETFWWLSQVHIEVGDSRPAQRSTFEVQCSMFAVSLPPLRNDSTAAKIGSGFITIPCPPPNGASSTV